MEIKPQTDLPPFLLGRTLQNWILRNRSNLEIREKRWQQLLITDPNLVGKDAGNMGFVYRFQTPETNPWKIFVDKQTPTFNQNTSSLPKNLFIGLELRQQFSEPKNQQGELQSELQRQQAQDFLAANWEKIARIFYSNSDEIEDDKLNLPVFTNVRLNKNQILDLLAFRPDGRIFVFYFGRRDENLPEKVESLMNLKSGLTILNGLTSFTDKENNLILTIQESS